MRAEFAIVFLSARYQNPGSKGRPHSKPWSIRCSMFRGTMMLFHSCIPRTYSRSTLWALAVPYGQSPIVKNSWPELGSSYFGPAHVSEGLSGGGRLVHSLWSSVTSQNGGGVEGSFARSEQPMAQALPRGSSAAFVFLKLVIAPDGGISDVPFANCSHCTLASICQILAALQKK